LVAILAAKPDLAARSSRRNSHYEFKFCAFFEPGGQWPLASEGAVSLAPNAGQAVGQPVNPAARLG
jgi:hypothetical protein